MPAARQSIDRYPFCSYRESPTTTFEMDPLDLLRPIIINRLNKTPSTLEPTRFNWRYAALEFTVIPRATKSNLNERDIFFSSLNDETLLTHSLHMIYIYICVCVCIFERLDRRTDEMTS